MMITLRLRSTTVITESVFVKFMFKPACIFNYRPSKIGIDLAFNFGSTDIGVLNMS